MDTTFMRLALDEARLALEHGDVPVGAVMVVGGKVVAFAHNERECRPDPVAHAEVLALQRAAAAMGTWRMDAATLYCTLEPCVMCAGAMVAARLGRLVYAADDPKAGAAGSILDLVRAPFLNHQVRVTRGILAAGAEGLLQHYFADRRVEG